MDSDSEKYGLALLYSDVSVCMIHLVINLQYRTAGNICEEFNFAFCD